ncbi:hypothetical protein RJ639_024213 [Escallonia herrerae]|uniref:UDP-glycosyltransferase n=1 Tax=Escallonia herrerae TaxID=1293975 RepID=A0AA88V2T2_9ASTE|nr:hypothetical protein RJ639_024213 [Escallonia herrerae]
MEKEGIRSRRTVVLVPCPLQGHISPMLELGTILHSKGFSIVIVHSTFYAPKASNHPAFVFSPLSYDLFDPDTSPENLIAPVHDINRISKEPFQECLTQIRKQQEPHDDIACVIYDPIMYFSEAVASHLKLPSIMFYTASAASLVAYYSVSRLRAEGYIPFQESMSADLVPNLHPLRFKDLPNANLGNLEGIKKVIEAAKNIRTSSGIIWNTIPHLEHSSLAVLQQHYRVPFFPVGPLHKLAPATSCSLLLEDADCIKWLDKQAPSSVIYVSLGSLAIVVEKELAEMAWGLANSGIPFLWVIRPGFVRNSEWIKLLPDGFEEKTGERGRIVKWAPQKEVLAHDAVGGFWSHCGWNSTVEILNAWYLCDVWKIGLELEHDLKRGEIEKAVKRLMIDIGRQEMRQRASDMKVKAELCVREGGASYNSLNDLAELILSF